jgi:hypothetical protein
MSIPSNVRSSIRAALHRADLEREMHDELQFHIEQYARDLQQQGLSPEEALRRARAQFGSIDAGRRTVATRLGSDGSTSFGTHAIRRAAALAAVLLMLVIALVAGWWPARAAASLDPMQALRHE